MVVAVGLAFQAGPPNEDRREALSLSERGLDDRPRRLLLRNVFVAYHEIEKLEIVDDEGDMDLRIEHAGGILTLHRMRVHDPDSFEEFAEMRAARSRKNLGGGWFI